MALCRLASYRDGREGRAKVCMDGVWMSLLGWEHINLTGDYLCRQIRKG
jgi:hypothetical protein